MHHLSPRSVCPADPAHHRLKGLVFLHPLSSLDQSLMALGVLSMLWLLGCPGHHGQGHVVNTVGGQDG